MRDTKFLEDIDPQTLSVRAMTSVGESVSAGGELQVIRQACRELSEQFPDHYLVKHDGREFRTEQHKDSSGQTTTNIYFNTELHSK